MKKRIRYKKAIAVDGDTLAILYKGERRYVRVLGLDTDEITSTNKKERTKAKAAKNIFERKLNKCFIKPRLYGIQGKSREGGWPFWKHHNGRILAHVYIWRWFRFIDYADYMKSRKLVKKNSRWNK